METGRRKKGRIDGERMVAGGDIEMVRRKKKGRIDGERKEARITWRWEGGRREG